MLRYLYLIAFLAMIWMILYSRFQFIKEEPSSTGDIINEDKKMYDFNSSLVKAYAAQISGSHVINVTISPQHEALVWLEESNYTTTSKNEFFDRYILSTLYFSTSGLSWSINNWINQKHHCSWYGCTRDNYDREYCMK